MGIISFRGAPIPIPAKQIDDLQKLLAQKVPCSLHAFLKVGQAVRIRGGCLDGLEGILAQRGDKNLVISIESIQRSVAITIEGYELELI
jgi:transcription antitermination factor NusG